MKGKVNAAMAEALGKQPLQLPPPPALGMNANWAVNKRSDINRNKTRVNTAVTFHLCRQRKLIKFAAELDSKMQHFF